MVIFLPYFDFCAFFVSEHVAFIVKTLKMKKNLNLGVGVYAAEICRDR